MKKILPTNTLVFNLIFWLALPVGATNLSAPNQRQALKTPILIETPFRILNLVDEDAFRPDLTRTVTNILISLQNDLDFVVVKQTFDDLANPELVFGLSYEYNDRRSLRSSTVQVYLRDPFSNEQVSEATHVFFHQKSKGKDLLHRDAQKLLLQLQPIIVKLMAELLPSHKNSLLQHPSHRMGLTVSPRSTDIDVGHAFSTKADIPELVSQNVQEVTYNIINNKFAGSSSPNVLIERKNRDEKLKKHPNQINLKAELYASHDTSTYTLELAISRQDLALLKTVHLIAEPLKNGYKRAAYIRILKAIDLLDIETLFIPPQHQVGSLR